MNKLKTTVLSLVGALTLTSATAQFYRESKPHVHGIYDLDNNGKTDDMVFSVYDRHAHLHTLYQQKYNQETQTSIGEKKEIPLQHRIDNNYPAYSNLRAFDIDKDGDLDLYLKLARNNYDDEYHSLINTQGTFTHGQTLIVKYNVYPQPIPLHQEYSIIKGSTKKFVDHDETIFAVRRAQYGEEAKEIDLFCAVVRENLNANESKYEFATKPIKMGALIAGPDYRVSYFTGDFDDDGDKDFKVVMQHETNGTGMQIFYLNVSPHTPKDKAALDEHGLSRTWIEYPVKF